jgi:phosphomannomutase
MTDYSKFFKAYDVRGTFPEIDQKVFYWTGFGLVSQILTTENLPLKVAVCHDCRYTSPKFYKAFCAGVTDAGGEVIALGLGSTDFLYAATQTLDCSGAVITASHNPKDDNGVKIVKKAPQMLGLNSGLAIIRDFVLAKAHQDLSSENWLEPVENTELKRKVGHFYQNTMHHIGRIDEVSASLVRLYNQGRRFKIVADCGNGMGGWVMDIMSKLYPEIEFVKMYWDLDGNFPNHPADPSHRENLKELQLRVVEEKADLGLAFDGDADRCYFVDEKGELMEGNFVVAVLAKTFLQDLSTDSSPKFNPAIVYSQPQSRAVAFTVLDYDGVPVPSRQGHTFIKANMVKYKAVYGGEGSGHHYFGEFGYMDSGVLAAVKIISLLVLQNLSASELLSDYTHRYFLSGEINFQLAPGQTFEQIKSAVLDQFTDGIISQMDGVSVFYSDWKFNLRTSNTEPLVRLNVECIGQDQVAAKVDLVRTVVGL